MRANILSIVLLGVFTLGNGHAGSASDPEIADGVGDVSVRAVLIADVATSEVDLTRAWLSVASGSVRVHIGVVDVDARTVPGSGAIYHMTYSDDVNSFAYARALRSGDSWTFRWLGTNWNGTTTGQATTGDVLSSVIVIDVPQHLVSGVMRSPRASTILLVDGGPNGGPAWVRDIAPDSGSGRDFDPSA